MEQNDTNQKHLQQLAFVGTYLPRRCGIGTFTRDLLEATAIEAPSTDVWSVAINDRPEGYRYPPRVKFEINERRIADYRLAADFLNTSRVNVVSIQHEYGIFGGENGEHILKLIQQLHMPVVTTLHTVLKDPTDGQRHIMLELARLSDRLVVMAHKAHAFLKDIYQIPDQKIVHIPHGIPDVPFIDPNFYKDQFGVEGKKVILTFGLLSSGKGIELMINALPQIVEVYPQTVYIVLGATHPHVQATAGEDYRTALERRAEKKGVSENVIFHNHFVELKELCEYLGAADIYVTPYLSEAQIVSGSLAYALGAGNAVVSTPYWYAQELLGNGRGRLVPFKDANSLAASIINLLDKEVERHAMRKQGYLHTRPFVWSKVARQYLSIFNQCEQERRDSPRPATTTLRTVARKPELPEIKLDHLRALTDDTTILRHAKAEVPDLAHGYSTDETARALIAVLKARDHLPGGTGCSKLINRYLAFLNHALDPANGRFRNLMSYDRRWLEELGSEDSHGRAIWALGEMVARAERKGHTILAVQLFHAALPQVVDFTAPRAWAYCLIGIHAYLRCYSGDTEVKRYRSKLSEKLVKLYERRADDQWLWPEPYLTYENAQLPHALLLCGQWMFDSKMAELALRSLDWLLSQLTADDGHFSPIGNQGWYERGKTKAHFDQQPLEAHATIDACLEAFRMTREPHWHQRAFRIFNWFLGDNDLRAPLYDPNTGGCYDGLHSGGVNENQGAEATVAWLLALTSLYETGAEITETKPPQPEKEAKQVAEPKTLGIRERQTTGQG